MHQLLVWRAQGSLIDSELRECSREIRGAGSCAASGFVRKVSRSKRFTWNFLLAECRLSSGWVGPERGAGGLKSFPVFFFANSILALEALSWGFWGIM